jgi:hypothetical protein
MANANKIFRYKLSDDIMLNITQFAKIHQFDDRHQYKEAWGNWLTENQDNVEREVVRLQQLEYTGDIIDKMFKAGRYYFREKVTVKKQTEPKKRDYIVMHPEIIQAMDLHLRSLINTNDFKPAKAYNHFCEQHIDLLRKEILRLTSEHKTITGQQMSAKFKKTYKNRYFGLQSHLQSHMQSHLQSHLQS